MVAELRQLDRRSREELTRVERKVIQLESTRAWQRVHRLGQITETSAVVGRPDWAEQAGAELQRLAAKQLRMLGENGGNVS